METKRPVSQVAEHKVDIERIIKGLISLIGEDSGRQGLVGTPDRVARAYQELYSGYNEDPAAILSTEFDEAYEDLVIMKHITFTSMCEHHMLPFFGEVFVGIIPQGHKVVGASKVARVVDVYSRRLQIQERMTRQIATIIMETLQPLGVGVVVEAKHFCITARGVKNPTTTMSTDCMLGNFKAHTTKMEFLNRISHG